MCVIVILFMVYTYGYTVCRLYEPNAIHLNTQADALSYYFTVNYNIYFKIIAFKVSFMTCKLQ